MQLNEMLIDRAGVAGVPGSAFADSDDWNNYMRLCIAREDGVLQGALDKLQSACKSMQLTSQTSQKVIR